MPQIKQFPTFGEQDKSFRGRLGKSYQHALLHPKCVSESHRNYISNWYNDWNSASSFGLPRSSHFYCGNDLAHQWVCFVPHQRGADEKQGPKSLMHIKRLKLNENSH